MAGLGVALAVAGAAPPASAAIPDGATLVPAAPDLLPSSPTSRMAGTISLSADGATALVGGEASASNGSNLAALFTRTDGVWSRQAEFPQNASGSALSLDGSTAIVGNIFGVDGRSGAASAFVRSAGWGAQGPSFSPYAAGGGSSATWFGAAVALSASGDVAVIGAPEVGGQGTAWVYERQGGVWVQGARLGPEFSFQADRGGHGRDVAISGDGTMILSASSFGVETYLRSGGTWAAGPVIPAQGTVSLSSDARHALVGGAVFAWDGSAWASESQLPLAADERVVRSRMSADASTVIATTGTAGEWGNIGSTQVRVFARRSGGWSVVAGPLAMANPPTEYPNGLGISGDGRTVMVGSNQRTSVFSVGAAVGAVRPASGSRGGGERVRITGLGFVDVREVRFGGVPARRFVVRSPTEMEAVTPAVPPGVVHVSVVAGDATPPQGRTDGFRFLTPRVSLGTGGLRARLARPRVRLSCARTTCTGTARLLGARKVVLARGTFTVRAGARRTVALKLTRTGKRAVRRRLARATLVVDVPGMPTVRRTLYLR